MKQFTENELRLITIAIEEHILTIDRDNRSIPSIRQAYVDLANKVREYRT